MKFRKIAAAAVAVTLCAGLAVPVSATGYAGGPWNRPYYYYYYNTPRPSRDHNYKGSDKRDTDRSSYYPTGTGTTNIPDNSTPTGQTPNTATLHNNNGATPLTANKLVLGENGIYTAINASTVAPALLQNIKGVVHNDVKVGNAILARFYLNAPSIASLPQNIDLSISVDAADTAATKAKYEKHFGGNVQVVSMAQKSSFGTNIQMAVHTGLLKGVNLSNLKVLIHNKYTNKYSKVHPNDIKVQGNYVYFTIPKGGELVFTDSGKL